MTDAPLKIKSLRGMSDILPEEIKFWRYLENLAHNLFTLYGYKEIRQPLLEETGLFVRSIGGDTEIVKKEMYTIKEKEGENLSLRPEATASLVRAFLEHSLYRESGIKRYYYLGPMFRRERPQAGRKRQFHQVGVEAIGSGHPAMDAEVINLAGQFLIEAGIKNFEIQLNHLGCQDCRKKYIKVLKDYFKTFQRALCPDCQRRFKTNPLRILDCKKETCHALIKSAPKISNSLCLRCQEHFVRVQKFLEFSGIDFRLNARLVRGLDYYTGVVFELSHPELGAQNALAAGGRYDNLIEKFGGPSLPATGFSFGLERVIMALKKEEVPVAELAKTEVFLIVLGEVNLEEGFKILQKLRGERLRLEMDFEDKSLKALLRQANKIGVKFVLILGDEERQKESIIVKDMSSGEQKLVRMERLAGFLKRLLKI